MRSLATLIALICGCHSATLFVERKPSGGTERDHVFEPRRGADHHYISLPAYPFVNCVDVLFADGSENTHQSVGSTPCAHAEDFTNFVGYRPQDVLPGASVTWVEDYAESAQRDELADLDDLAQPTNTEAHGEDLPWPKPLFSFIHFSDIQIREPEAKLGGSTVSHTLDPLVPSFERDHDQELFSAFVYAALVDTINKELTVKSELAAKNPALKDPTRLEPAFMIHTGDSVDAGLQSEFDEFQMQSDRLQIPWYQSIGNHDALAFGNLRMLDPDQVAKDEDNDNDRHRCLGSHWGNSSSNQTPCTCTRVADLIREYNLAAPDNLGVFPEVPAKLFTLVPTLLNRLCLIHDVAGDMFVMDPNQYGTTMESFISAHCRPGRNANGDAICRRHKVTHGEYLAIDRNDKKALCATLATTTAHDELYAKDPTANLLMDDASVLNGFDLGPDDMLIDRVERRVLHDEKLSNNGKPTGYYCFEVKTEDAKQRAWAIVLNTTTSSGAYGEVKSEQLLWLKRVLAQLKGSSDLVMVFAHHPIWDILDQGTRNALVETLTSSKNVIGFFAGHTHSPYLRLVHPPKGHDADSHYHHFWEVIAPAVISFPQQGRQVTIKTSDKLGYIEILSFSPVGDGENAERIARANAGARRDYCNDAPKSCINGEPRLPSRTVTFPRLFFTMPQAEKATP